MSQFSVKAARITRLAFPTASPGNCGICGKSKHPDGFAFFDLHFEMYGTLFLCADCVGETARLFNYISTTTAGDLEAVVAEQQIELANLRQAILLLEASVEQLTDYRNLRVGERRVTVNDSGDTYAALSVPDQTVNRTSLSGEGDGSEADQLNDESGRDDVRDSASPESGPSPVPL